MARARNRDQRAWATLVGLYINDIWKLSLHLLDGDLQAAEDLAQQTWEKAYAGLVSFRGDVPLLAWLRKICRNCQVDEWRRRRRHQEIVHGSSDDNGDGEAELSEAMLPGAFEDQRNTSLDVRQALARLDEDEREAILLVKVAGYTSLEVGEIVGVPPSTIRSRVARAREKLATSLGDYQCKAS